MISVIVIIIERRATRDEMRDERGHERSNGEIFFKSPTFSLTETVAELISTFEHIFFTYRHLF